jgi:hypothetical protein
MVPHRPLQVLLSLVAVAVLVHMERMREAVPAAVVITSVL